jgi:hypothetical protein
MDDDKPSPQKSLDFMAEIGNGDISGREPYSAKRMAAKARAAGSGRGTLYRHFIVEEGGAPFCLQHKIEMAQLTIPRGYKNSGVEVWVCPQFDCREWELVESLA